MQYWSAQARPDRRPVVTVGTFDGVHLGHQRLIASARTMAEELEAALVVVTFDRHPLTVLHPARAPRILTPLPVKLEYLAALDVPWVRVLPFTPSLAQLTPEGFLEQELGRAMEVAGVTIGYNFTFGAGAKGTAATLRQWGAQQGIPVRVLDPVRSEDRHVVSSSAIRRLIEGGDLAAANRALGHLYTVVATVERGMGRGRQIGVPTANLAPDPDQVMPPFGVYVGWARCPEWPRAVGAIANWGIRPTFGDAPRPLLEVHLLEEAGYQLVGRTLGFGFWQRLREERRFTSVEELVAQIRRDLQTAREQVASQSAPAVVVAPAENRVVQ